VIHLLVDPKPEYEAQLAPDDEIARLGGEPDRFLLLLAFCLLLRFLLCIFLLTDSEVAESRFFVEARDALGQAKGFQLALDNFAEDCASKEEECPIEPWRTDCRDLCVAGAGWEWCSSRD